MTDLTPDLVRLGDTLERAAAADLAALAPQGRRRRLPGRALLAAAVLAVAVPGLAYAATQLLTEEDVARSLPDGTLALAGTEPRCTVVEQDVEYHCLLQHAPAPEVTDWTGTVEPTVDATKHVNGGCRSLRADGREWRCYLGQAAVEQQIIGEGFLGEYAPSPGVG